MTIEQGDLNAQTAEEIKQKEGGEASEESKETQRDLERVRRNIAKIVDSGKLTSDQAEKLARMQITGKIEEIEESTDKSQEEGLIKVKDGVVDFGKDEYGQPVTMEVFKPEDKTWTPKFFPHKSGKYLTVGFVANDGTEFIDPENGQVTTSDDLEEPEVQNAVAIEQEKLEKHLEEEKEKKHSFPKKKSEFKETDHSVSTMRQIAHLMSRQEKAGRGLLIIEGEAGTGKNWMIDHIAHLTNRPVFRFTCDGSKETPELKYILEFVTDEKGSRTQRINSTIIEALQTEGAILELDEINTLRPDVAKSLNSLFDADRALYFGEDDVKVRAARGVLIIGLMNPANYAGVNEVAETIADRARFLETDYPPYYGEDEDGDPILLSDEAEMIYSYFPEFRGISQTEFRDMWHQIVNGKQSKSAQSLLNPSRQLRVVQLKMLINIASKVREAYRQYQEGLNSNIVSYNFTLRKSVDCAIELADMDLPTTEGEAEDRSRRVVSEVFVPQFKNEEEKKNIESIINAI